MRALWQVEAGPGRVGIVLAHTTFSPEMARKLAEALLWNATWAESLAASQMAADAADAAQADTLRRNGWSWYTTQTKGHGYWGRYAGHPGNGQFNKSRTGPYAEVTREAFEAFVE